ncbi:MAG TPA: hypothetical protein VGO57_17165 [Verrucomicrobiae bacterium]
MANKTDSLKQYVSLRQSLLNEKKTLEVRLQAINSALNSASKATVTATNEAAPVVKKKRKMSAAGRARIVAAQKARWAKVKAGKK